MIGFAISLALWVIGLYIVCGVIYLIGWTIGLFIQYLIDCFKEGGQ